MTPRAWRSASRRGRRHPSPHMRGLKELSKGIPPSRNFLLFQHRFCSPSLPNAQWLRGTVMNLASQF
ncbi:hypothetical protein LCER1_G000357 [Lachnellula cervina]|uniref:Uncharacterized protein n=1 Tax=Lachnellula cervina TaxID=1316786 RepID=A0A7D8UXU2_9HELO|nr:hypothetical protein LCER1_G000357 [Lachnellula cervina]